MVASTVSICLSLYWRVDCSAIRLGVEFPYVDDHTGRPRATSGTHLHEMCVRQQDGKAELLTLRFINAQRMLADTVKFLLSKVRGATMHWVHAHSRCTSVLV